MVSGVRASLGTGGEGGFGLWTGSMATRRAKDHLHCSASDLGGCCRPAPDGEWKSGSIKVAAALRTLPLITGFALRRLIHMCLWVIQRPQNPHVKACSAALVTPASTRHQPRPEQDLEYTYSMHPITTTFTYSAPPTASVQKGFSEGTASNCPPPETTAPLSPPPPSPTSCATSLPSPIVAVDSR